MFMHIARDDIILGLMRFDSDAYKTYLAYATGEASPKMKRKLKKPASPSKKRTLITEEEKEPEPAKNVKKAPAKVARSMGIELLSNAALLEEAQLKKVLIRSKRETSIHKAGGSSEEADSKLEVPDEPKGKSIDTSKGTGLKPGVPDVSKGDSSKSTNNLWVTDEEEEYDSNIKEEQKQDDEFIHTPDDYVPTDDETNDEYKEFDEEEYEELY
ncbi:hypothetical protein Tco_1034118 [Tanacetum coccineum]